MCMSRHGWWLCCVIIVLLTAQSAQAINYAVTPLDSPWGYPAQVYAIDFAGRVVGYGYGPTGHQAVLWYRGGIEGLGLMTGGINSEAKGVCGDLIVGTGNVPGFATRAFRSVNEGFLMELGTLGGASSNAMAVNGDNWIVGNSALLSTAQRAFRFKDGLMWEIPPLNGLAGSSNYATDINEDGWVVGQSKMGAGIDNHGFLYSLTSTQLTDLGTLGGSESYAQGVNSSRQVVGYSSFATPAGTRAFLCQDGVIQNLPGLNDATAAAAKINDLGQIVGYSMLAGVQHGVLWDAGQVYDLNDLIPAGTGITLQNAMDINNMGQICVNGKDSRAAFRAYLLTPVHDLGGMVAVTPGDATVAWNEVTIDFTGVTGGEVTADSYPTSGGLMNQLPGGQHAMDAWNITTSGGFDIGDGNAVLTFSYDPDTLPPGVLESELKIYHWDGVQWDDVTGGVDTDLNTIVSIPVSDFSPFAMTPEPGTLSLLGLGALAIIRRTRKGGRHVRLDRRS